MSALTLLLSSTLALAGTGQRTVSFELLSVQIERNGAPCPDCRIDWLPAISCAVEGRNEPTGGPQRVARYKIVPSGNGLGLEGTARRFSFEAAVGEELVCAVAGQWVGWSREALASRQEGEEGALPRAPTEIFVVPEQPQATSEGEVSTSVSRQGRTWSYRASYRLTVSSA